MPKPFLENVFEEDDAAAHPMTKDPPWVSTYVVPAMILIAIVVLLLLVLDPQYAQKLHSFS
jgi:hypothetical protein